MLINSNVFVEFKNKIETDVAGGKNELALKALTAWNDAVKKKKDRANDAGRTALTKLDYFIDTWNEIVEHMNSEQSMTDLLNAPQQEVEDD
uniref:Uncharacterized protein n=1 Tax=Chromera velia CCMP2878 TaxID=1169474 RepID=A0A0G4GNY1_9ALVE|eukprot:Cvel_22738.t1-p1 / transcript=Cvel_22738.t1 / gene=Cvel_22738 / organism=Chromera_velia_CCMP2878 / gene_product=hypothetical protein / transcript_product=hypothetical protein / location=Cvel_scaffold2267:28742-29011(-) / protein_length=90 / sequence_SO=supercontig / SO=protein_coding / is_pseudo=false